MGHPYRGQVNLQGLIPPLPVLLPLAVVDTFVVVLPAAPWMCQPGHPVRLLLAPVVGLAIGLLLCVQAVLWHFLRTWWVGSKAEADAAFATVSEAPPAVAVPEPVGEPATFLVKWVPERRGPLAWFDVHVDDRPVWSVTGERLSAVTVSEGCHRVFIKVNHMVSDVIEVDLAGGDVVHLACGMKPLMRNRFWRAFVLKLRYIVCPAALVAVYVPAVMRFIDRHFRVEILATGVLVMLGAFLSLPRYFSRRPGAMVYLVEQPDPPGAD